jgi:hypothetical protein
MSERLISGPYRRLYSILLAIGCIAFSTALIGYIGIGSFMRYSGDDYCYGAMLTQHGFWKAQWLSFQNPMPYHGNRYSLTFLSGISGLFNPAFNGFLPGMAIVVWVLGFLSIFATLGRLLTLQIHWMECLLASEIVVFFTLNLAPDLSQSLYWRSGMLPYLAPLIVIIIMISYMLKKLEGDNLSRLALVLIPLSAFFAGGFSETATALQTGFLLLALLGTWILKKRGSKKGSWALLLLLAALIGTSLAMMLLIVSPANLSRRVDLPAPPDFVNLVRMAAHSAYIFTHATVKHLLLPNLLLASFFVVLSVQICSRRGSAASIRGARFFGPLALIPVIGFLLIICCMAPSAYAQSSYPELRALITARFVTVVSAASFGWWIGVGIWRLKNRIDAAYPYLLFGSAIMLSIMSIYPLLATKSTLSELPRYRKWATFWDIRDAEIRSIESQGINEIDVVKIDNIIPRVGDLSDDPGYWYNNCAEMYYGMSRIRANLPGWDE